MSATKPLFAEVALRPQLPRKLYRQIAPSNPFAPVRFTRTVDLMYTRQLAATIREEQLAKLRANSTWLRAFEMLEKRGLHLGVHVNDVAAALGITPIAAKRTMLKAEEMIYAIYGINISFIDKNGVWRLATEREVAVKHAEMLKTLRKVTKRLSMYSMAARELGKPGGTLAVPIFELPEDFRADAPTP